MADAQGISVVIDEDNNSVRVDPVTGTVETDQPDGGVVVQLDAHRPKQDDEDNQFDRNLVDEIPAGMLSTIANELHDAITADDTSRGNYLEISRRGLDFLGLEIKEPRANVGDTSASVEGMSTVTNPLLLDACLKGWANSQAELLPSEGPVKIDDDGAEASQVEDSLADALERDMNHYLMVTASEYYPDTSHMLLWGVYFRGSGFKKIYRCPMKRRPVSESVPAEDLIVSNTVKDLKSCARITHQIKMRPSVMKRMEFIGAYRKTPSIEPTPTANTVDEGIAAIQGTQATPRRPEDQPFNLWETQCELDLDQFAPPKFKGRGLPLPYIVTMDKDSREIKAIRRNWDEDDEECERKRMYVKYPYVPGPGFYGTGLLNILGNASNAMTAAWRLSLDAAMFANFPSFLVAKSATRQNTSDFRVGPGTGVALETGGQPIGNVASAMPYKDVSVGMLTLMDKITQQCQSLGGSADIPTAEGVVNVPVGTMLAQIEQATKVMAAAHKGMHQAQAEEIELIVDLFRQYPEDFWKSNKKCPKGFWNEQLLMQALNDCNLAPRSDPNTPSHIHRVARALGLVQLTTNPAVAPRLNIDEILTRALNAIGENPQGLILPRPAPAAPMPDPQMIIAGTKVTQANTAQFKAQSDAENTQRELDIKQQQVGVDQNIATVDLAKEMVIHKDDNALAAKQHGLATAQAGQQAGLAASQAVHDQKMDLAQHALNVHQVLNPPQSADSGENS
jgi:hypothetical protein